jgi:hypothetical protein
MPCYYCFTLGNNPFARMHNTSNCNNKNNTHGPNYIHKQVVITGHSRNIIHVVKAGHTGHAGGAIHIVKPNQQQHIVVMSPGALNNVQRYETGSFHQEAEVRPDSAMRYCYSCNARKLFVKRNGCMNCNTCS